jgi:hypothetical protein
MHPDSHLYKYFATCPCRQTQYALFKQSFYQDGSATNRISLAQGGSLRDRALLVKSDSEKPARIADLTDDMIELAGSNENDARIVYTAFAL